MNNLIVLFIVLAVLAVFIVLVARGKKEIIYKMIYALVDEAEDIYGSKAGKLKFSYVLEKLYAILPTTIKLFVTYKMLEGWIETALIEMKKYWAEKAQITDDTITVKGFSND